MQDLNDLWYFVQVVDNGGFSPASRAIGIPKSRLSRRIALLEDRLETRLLQALDPQLHRHRGRANLLSPLQGDDDRS
ncbi:LysR family transcriptional regulator [Cedecea neteri]|uniref:LysR family transcriptional regulator n=1 Tax=Cedecea neteri TaxID=158822 RepID=A0A2X3IYU4_9ENTR|nr:LysR family transcriptional regulator [Cedecea neteri]